MGLRGDEREETLRRDHPPPPPYLLFSGFRGSFIAEDPATFLNIHTAKLELGNAQEECGKRVSGVYVEEEKERKEGESKVVREAMKAK